MEKTPLHARRDVLETGIRNKDGTLKDGGFKMQGDNEYPLTVVENPANETGDEITSTEGQEVGALVPQEAEIQEGNEDAQEAEAINPDDLTLEDIEYQDNAYEGRLNANEAAIERLGTENPESEMIRAQNAEILIRIENLKKQKERILLLEARKRLLEEYITALYAEFEAMDLVDIESIILSGRIQSESGYTGNALSVEPGILQELAKAFRAGAMNLSEILKKMNEQPEILGALDSHITELAQAEVEAELIEAEPVEDQKRIEYKRDDEPLVIEYTDSEPLAITHEETPKLGFETPEAPESLDQIIEADDMDIKIDTQAKTLGSTATNTQQRTLP